MPKLQKILPAFFGLITCSFAHAAYLVNGKVEGQVCKGVGIEVCEMREVSAVKDKEGRISPIAERFEDVTEYSESKKRCLIRTKASKASIIAWAASNKTDQPTFYERTPGGSYKEVDVRYVSFPCIKQ